MSLSEHIGFKRILLGLMILGNWGLSVSCATQPNIPERESPAAQLFLKTCTQCHSYPHPKRHTSAEWTHYVKLMEDHMKNNHILFSLEDKKIILGYLHRNAR